MDIWVFEQGEYAQLILLPIYKTSLVKHRQSLQKQDSLNKTTRRKITFIQEVTESRPICFIEITGKFCDDLLDTDVEEFVVASQQWPATRPTKRPLPPWRGWDPLDVSYKGPHPCFTKGQTNKEISFYPTWHLFWLIYEEEIDYRVEFNID